MHSLISIAPSDEFEIVGVKAVPHMATISTMPLPMYFPSLIQIQVRTRLEMGTITRSGQVQVDLGELSKMISQAMKEVRSMGKAMKDKDIQDYVKKMEDELETKPEDEQAKDGDLVFD